MDQLSPTFREYLLSAWRGSTDVEMRERLRRARNYFEDRAATCRQSEASKLWREIAWRADEAIDARHEVEASKAVFCELLHSALTAMVLELLDGSADD
jgi:hypothetical protein